MRARGTHLAALLLAVGSLACGKAEMAPDDVATLPGEEGGASSYTYEVVLSSAIMDTLRGAANFGRMLDEETGENLLVVRLSSPVDFAGGMLIARRNTDLPQPGTFGIAATSDTLALPESDFIIRFREGMLRDLRSVEGTLTLTTVTDTLLAGRFQAVLRGYVAEGSVRLPDARVNAAGRFRAKSGGVGYFLGL